MRNYSRRDIAERFWSHVTKTETCWLWTAQKTERGYGKFYDSHGRTTTAYTASRFAMFLETGKHVPPSKVIAHHCDNPSCVRPDHLFVTTQAGNIDDARQKGRLWVPSLRYRARTHCKHGHPFDPDNTRLSATGGLICRRCCAERMRRHRGRRANAIRPGATVKACS